MCACAYACACLSTELALNNFLTLPLTFVRCSINRGEMFHEEETILFMIDT